LSEKLSPIHDPRN